MQIAKPDQHGIPELFFRYDDKLDLKQGKFLTLMLDLSAPKNVLLKKVEEYLDHYRKKVDPSKGRITPERKAFKFLVWDEYLLTKSFKSVAEKSGQRISTIREAYLRAFEMIMGEKYTAKKYNKKAIPKEKQEKTCDLCPEKAKCKVLCPAVLPIVEQDQVYLREKLLLKGKDGNFLEPTSMNFGRRILPKLSADHQDTDP